MIIQSDDQRVSIDALKPRTLLACLIIEANRPVRTDLLIEELWGDKPPRSARANIRTYVTGLRTIVNGPAGGTIRATSSGYLFELSPRSSDVDIFHALAEAGHAAHAAGDASRGLASFDAAIALWRGRAMSDVVQGPLLGRRARQLEEERLATLEFSAQAHLDLGQNAKAVTLLRRIVAEYPLRERVQANLMTALYRSGDTAGALGVYATARRHLRDDLGVDPGPELSQVHRAVLTRDPSLAPDEPSARAPVTDRPDRLPTASAGTPAQLPADVSEFIGRRAQLELLRTTLTASSRPSRRTWVVTGAGGVGKSALAVHFAHQVADEFPDGLVYVDLRGASGGSASADQHVVLARILRAFGVSSSATPTSHEEAAATYRSLLAHRRVLLVLDNVDGAAQVRPLLPGTAACAVLVTSRRTLATLPGARHLRLDIFDPAEAMAMLGATVGTERAAADPTGVARLADRCGRLPLALSIAAAKLVSRPSWTPSDLADQLDAERHRLDLLTLDDLALRSSFAISYDGLARETHGAEAALAFRHLGLLAVPQPSLASISAMFGRPASSIRAGVELLVDVGLVDSPVSGRYRLPDLLGVYARELSRKAGEDDDRDRALLRALRDYLAMSRAAVAVLRVDTERLEEPVRTTDRAWFASPEEAASWLDEELANLVAVATAHAGRSAAAPLVVALTETLHPYLSEYGDLAQWRALRTASLHAVELDGVPDGQRLALRAVADVPPQGGERHFLAEPLRTVSGGCCSACSTPPGCVLGARCRSA
ncbi:AfsR/SARP family transcriptional regulator [Plantactinospora soyae]|uniref:DNA-binding SARP family transcriptional activator n=1 Tax=Plantactinospora soyae TaxID=1544732 RepID=A0A927M927_9ACTN|nr:BTAD domain-containing putative transcriptional regulator [Plantactinospora soyae]MBE1488906.1 DNA-binding SARP family transcriptional activator [Plantactinospora soyae]